MVTVKDGDGIRVTDHSSQANIFAESTHRTFRSDERVDDPVLFKDSQPMHLMRFTPDIVARHLVSLNPYKAAGTELTPAIFRPLYLAMVRPQLDCAVQAVAPYLQKDLKLVERMQRLATRCVKGLRGLQ